ncbi:hypothetical protein RFI_17513 [Reticulomyxa filosa]|uniref:Uncharacterized protein n=1 Tax=Reticulomyxa filosa TaxID=46433 RepID=X6N0B4_RETFI|nr:hypothetical protein RFI_17513 [Reticulomyxa filosa]|eukprot:ETO19720.1 hypothetical protein RFI_17513 [Reticulomyxa filosa]
MTSTYNPSEKLEQDSSSEGDDEEAEELLKTETRGKGLGSKKGKANDNEPNLKLFEALSQAQELANELDETKRKLEEQREEVENLKRQIIKLKSTSESNEANAENRKNANASTANDYWKTQVNIVLILLLFVLLCLQKKKKTCFL